jgi:hypothetical protein
LVKFSSDRKYAVLESSSINIISRKQTCTLISLLPVAAPFIHLDALAKIETAKIN